MHATLAAAIALLPAITALVCVWLCHLDQGRKVRLKFSPTGSLEEVEGQTPKQLRAVLQLADEYQRNHNKVITP